MGRKNVSQNESSVIIASHHSWLLGPAGKGERGWRHGLSFFLLLLILLSNLWEKNSVRQSATSLEIFFVPKLVSFVCLWYMDYRGSCDTLCSTDKYIEGWEGDIFGEKKERK
jgi:hypothetical protein